MASSATTSDAAPAAPNNAGDAAGGPAADGDGWPSDLAGLRAELDKIDDGIHNLLMRRADLVGFLANSRFKTPGVALRPGREADIIRRLVARHHGQLPPAGVARIWRELLSATTGMQSPQTVSVCEPNAGSGYVQIAREHFGALTPMRTHSTPGQALADVKSGAASVAVLPLPSETEPPGAAWWTALFFRDTPRLHVIARLPFWAPRPEGAPAVPAMVIAAFPADPSQSDRTLLGLEVPLDGSRARLAAAIAAAGLSAGTTILRRDPGMEAARALVEVAGMVAEDDPRLDAVGGALRRPMVLGAYAVPIGAAPSPSETGGR
ncbi:MAG: chorismate mutase [Proteobacteria bacterium]|nr:chorismate mutase [Pseudomonadota bacterium]